MDRHLVPVGSRPRTQQPEGRAVGSLDTVRIACLACSGFRGHRHANRNDNQADGRPITNLPIISCATGGPAVLPIWVGVVGGQRHRAADRKHHDAAPDDPRPAPERDSRPQGGDPKVVVSDLKDNTFYALISPEVNGEPLAVDARPSDAIALALRARAPIFVEDRSSTTPRPTTSPRQGRRRTAPEVAREPGSRRRWGSTRCRRARTPDRQIAGFSRNSPPPRSIAVRCLLSHHLIFGQ
jgi:bifunctional DNase/RNase